MGKLSEEQAKQLADLQALADASDDDDDEDFDIEIYNADGAGARLPYKKGKSWLSTAFGIDIGGEPAGDPAPPKKGYFGSAKGKPAVAAVPDPKAADGA